MKLFRVAEKAKRNFDVIREHELLLKAPNTLILTLTAPETYGIAEGQSVFYNNIAIGQIVKQHLNVDGVKFEAAIAAEYRNLIHENTQFVAASNFDVSLVLMAYVLNLQHHQNGCKVGCAY